MNILELKNITKKYSEIVALDNLSITFRAGRISGITGANGSGKSTLLNIVSGRQNADTGEIFLRQKQISDLNLETAGSYGIIHIFQEPKLFDQISVLDNMLATKTPRKIWPALCELKYTKYVDSIAPLLKNVGLWEKRNELTMNLSYGQRKLLQLIRAVATDASIFLLDEPFAGLFSETKKIIEQMILDLKKQGKTIILIEHDKKILRDLCDKIYTFNNGKVI